MTESPPPPRRVLEVRRDAAAEADSLVTGDAVSVVTFDEVAPDDVLDAIFAADVVVVV